ncbi:MAG: CSLREA domain-containing protein, partial [Acidobacteria bacterium]|nr:CSLREA domain-containing protein [Acidobacteriota bacterium]
VGIWIYNVPNNVIGGTAAGAGNVISWTNNNGAGVLIFGSNAAGTRVQGNYIGTDATGLLACGNTTGILLDGASGVLIGGASASARNVISANEKGISLNKNFQENPSNNNVIQGNYIGTNKDGIPNLGNTNEGVGIAFSASNTIGGLNAYEGNLIAGNGGIGIRVSSSNNAVANQISGNAIFGNTGLGIDLGTFGADGVTPNDTTVPADSDVGPNNLQNFPVLTAVSSGGLVTGTLNSTPNRSFRIEYFKNTACHSSGNGQGEVLLGTQTVTTDGSGNAPLSFSFAFDATKPFITATATDLTTNDTSEFSACRRDNRAPQSLSPLSVTRQQGSPVANSFIATVSDLDLPADTLTATVNGLASATVNGVTVSGLSVQCTGTNCNVSANVVAACGATTPSVSFNLAVNDSAGLSASATLIVNVSNNTPPGLSYNTPPSVNAGASLTINPASGPSDNGAVSNIAVQSAGTYTGTISVNSAGVVSISNAAPVGVHTITIRATDNCAPPGNFTDATFTLTVASSCPTITVSPSSTTPLPFGVTGSALPLIFLSASGGTGSYTFSDPANARPPGTTITSVSGSWRIGGVPNTPGVYTFSIQAIDANGCTGTTTLTVVIHPATPTLVVTTLADENGANLSACSLREAIIAANTNAAFGGCGAGQVGYDTIGFSITPAPSAYTINVNTNLPDLTEAVYLNGATGDAAFPRVEIHGAGTATTSTGLRVFANHCYLRNLVVNNCATQIVLQGGARSVIENCYLGTNATGAASAGGQIGVSVSNGATLNRIGATGVNQPNVVSGNSTVGVEFVGDTVASNSASGNLIGTNPTGVTAVPNGTGVRMRDGASFNSATSNFIAYNVGDGISISDGAPPIPPARSNSLSNNRIFSNGGLGINLAGGSNLLCAPSAANVTCNDVGDGDDGPNRLQNYPVLTSFTAARVVSGSLNSTPNSSFTIQYYASEAGDPSGFGEGEVRVFNATVTTDAGGNVSFTHTIPVPTPPAIDPLIGHPFITALAIAFNTSDTSEFSNWVTACGAPVIVTCATAQTVNANAACQTVVPDFTSGVVATNNCSSLGPLTITQSPAAGSMVGLGVHSVTITVKDGMMNTVTCMTMLTVNDTTAPNIVSCATAQAAQANASCQAAVPNFVSQITATDNCTLAGALTITQSPAAGTPLGLGTHTVTITVKDAANNMATCTTTFTVTDATPPTLSACPTNQTVTANAATGATVTYT